jgi:HAD superfamily hydrolase (TIGR01450 family)
VPFALDLDGVVWLADEPIPGAADAVARLRGRGDAVLFVTNNSSQTVAAVEAKLGAHGIPAAGDVITSAMAAATLVAPGERVLVCGGPGVVEAVEGRGAVVVHEGDAEAVLVGFHREFDYERMRIAATAVRRGARLIATNDDATYPTPDGPIPGGGAILASIATATGRQPVVAGKPYEPMAAAVRTLVGDPDGRLLMVGDRASTDGAFAVTLGCHFALVRTGVTLPGDEVGVPVAVDAADFARVVDALAPRARPG